MNTSALSVRAAQKIYQNDKESFEALKGVNLEIKEGSIHGLLGPNGAGKSTLIGMISNMLSITSGEIELFGVNVAAEPRKAKQLLGVVPQEIVTEHAFTVAESLYYFAGLNGVPVSERDARIDDVLTKLELIDKKDENARRLSGGMKRRLMIAKAIIHQPRFLILDEPTAGVDVGLRQRIWQLVREINAAGTTILFTTHYLEEAEELCEEITVIDHGKVIKAGRTRDIQAEFDSGMLYFELKKETTDHLPELEASGDGWLIPACDLTATLEKLNTAYGNNLKTVRSEKASLEKVFLELTKK